MTSTEKAIEIETARGRPSGTATITIETPIAKYLRTVWRVGQSSNLASVNKICKTKKRVIVMKIKAPPIYPNFPMYPASFSNLSWRGVRSSSESYSTGNSSANLVCFPTAATTALPEPVMIKVLARRKGSGFSRWCSSPLEIYFLVVIGLPSL